MKVVLRGNACFDFILLSLRTNVILVATNYICIVNDRPMREDLVYNGVVL